MIDGIDVAPQPWTGRDDGPDSAHAFWHSVMERADDPGRGVHLIGFCGDEGVRRYGGRPGAKRGPAELRRGLASLAAPHVSVADCGDVIVRGDDLEGAQERLGLAVGAVLREGGLPVVLGGGHELAYGTYLGWAAAMKEASHPRWTILNVDAHFDLRWSKQPTSGTPFLQIAIDENRARRDFSYAVVGVSRANNTRALFDRVAELGVRFVSDEEAVPELVGEFVSDMLADVDRVHLSIDLDVLPSCVAPGVSAPAGFGIDLGVVRLVGRLVAASGKLGTLEVAELNPEFDIEGRTARTAARLVDEIVRSRA